MPDYIFQCLGEYNKWNIEIFKEGKRENLLFIFRKKEFEKNIRTVPVGVLRNIWYTKSWKKILSTNARN